MSKSTIILSSIAVVLAILTIWTWSGHERQKTEKFSAAISHETYSKAAMDMSAMIRSNVESQESPRWEDNNARNNPQFYSRTVEEMNAAVRANPENYEGRVTPKIKDGRYSQEPSSKSNAAVRDDAKRHSLD
jgi:hypothetical protein